MIELLITLGVLYLAYRIIANGFRKPQSERLNGFGIFAIVMVVILGLVYASQWF